MTPAQVIQLFQTPETLLRQVNLVIAGGATRTPALPNMPLPPANGQAVVATFQVAMKGAMVNGAFVPTMGKGFTTGVSGFFRRKKDRPIATVTRLAGPAVAAPAADQLNAYYVPMVQTTDVAANTSHYSLPANGGPDIMITSKLSGCSFGVGSDQGGALLVSHVQPDLTLQGVNRANDLATHLGAGFANLTDSFAIRSEYNESAAVIGIRTNATWRFYLQAYGGVGAQTVVTKVKVI